MDVIYRLLWAILPGIITGVVMAAFNKRQKRQQEKDEKREFLKCKESKLNLDLTFASAQLAYASAVALKRGYANGEVEQGIEAYDKALEAYRKFEREQMANLQEL